MYNIWPADQVGSQGIACYVSAFPYPKNATEFMAEVSGSKYGVDPTYSDRYPWNLVDTGRQVNVCSATPFEVQRKA